MKQIWITRALATVVLIQLAGCSRPSGLSAKEEKITGSPADPPVELRANWSLSNRYVLNFEATMNSDALRPNRARGGPMEIVIGHDYAITVTNAPSDGSHEVDLEFLSVQCDVSVGDTTRVSYDSENKVIGTGGNPLAERLQTMVGGRIGCRLSPDNTVLRIAGAQTLADRLLSADAQGRGQAWLKRVVTLQYFKKLVELMSLPGKPVRIGDAWAAHREMDSNVSGSTLTIDLTCTFKGWQLHEGKNCAIIEFSGPVKTKENNKSVRRAALGLSPTLESGRLTGRTWFNAELGFIAETVTDQALTFKIPTGNNRPAQTNATNSVTQGGSTTATAREHSVIKLVEVGPSADASKAKKSR